MSEKDKKNPWFKPKPYLHLTNKIATQGTSGKEFQRKRDNIIQCIKSRTWVAKHAFFPLLRYDIIERRYKKRTVLDENKESVTLQQRVKSGNLRSFRSHKQGEGNERKSTKKVRGIEFPTHIDSLIFGYYKELLYEKYDALLKQNAELNKVVLAYRFIPQDENADKGKNVAHFAKEVFDEIKQRTARNGSCIALCFDVEGFFPSLCHNRILEVWKTVMQQPERLSDDHFAVYRAMTKFRYININDLKNQPKYEQKMAALRKKGIHSYFEDVVELRNFIKEGRIKVHKNDKEAEKKGIPHGLAISSTVANMYLLAFDEAIVNDIVKDKNGFYRRYSDDIVILCKEGEQDNVKQKVMAAIKNIDLKIQPAKTDMFCFTLEDGICTVRKWVQEQDIATQNNLETIKRYWKPNVPLVYLGFEFYGNKTLIKSASLAKYYRRMFDALRRKAARLKKHRERHADDTAPAFLKKIERLYTVKGINPQQIRTKQIVFKLEDEVTNWLVPKEMEVKVKVNKETGKEEPDHRGNILTYINRVSHIINEPRIKRQFRRHQKLFDAAWKKYCEKQGIEA